MIPGLSSPRSASDIFEGNLKIHLQSKHIEETVFHFRIQEANVSKRLPLPALWQCRLPTSAQPYLALDTVFFQAQLSQITRAHKSHECIFVFLFQSHDTFHKSFLIQLLLLNSFHPASRLTQHVLFNLIKACPQQSAQKCTASLTM